MVVFAATVFLAVPKQDVFAVSTVPSSITATPGPNSGEVTLTWNQSETVQKYSLVFGNSSGNYTMGLLEFPQDLRSLTVHNLTTGKTYFFQVWAFDDRNGPATPSIEVSAVAK